MYLGESIGNVFQKATGVGCFRDRYLDGFLGVASLIATLYVSFKEHHCRKDDLYLVIFQVDWRMVEYAQAGKTTHMLDRRAIKHHCNGCRGIYCTGSLF